MFAQALSIVASPAAPAPKALKKPRPKGRLTPHQRLVLKAEALFPGSVIVSESVFEPMPSLASAS